MEAWKRHSTKQPWLQVCARAPLLHAHRHVHLHLNGGEPLPLQSEVTPATCNLRMTTRASARSLASERTYPHVHDCGPTDLYPVGTRMVVSERLLGTVAGGRVGAPAGPPPARPNQGTGSTSCAFSCGALSSSSVSQPSLSWRQHWVCMSTVPIFVLLRKSRFEGLHSCKQGPRALP